MISGWRKVNPWALVALVAFGGVVVGATAVTFTTDAATLRRGSTESVALPTESLGREKRPVSSLQELLTYSQLAIVGKVVEVSQGRVAGEPELGEQGLVRYHDVQLEIEEILLPAVGFEAGFDVGSPVLLEMYFDPGATAGALLAVDSAWWQPESHSVFFLRAADNPAQAGPRVLTGESRLWLAALPGMYYLPDGIDGRTMSTSTSSLSELVGVTVPAIEATVQIESP